MGLAVGVEKLAGAGLLAGGEPQERSTTPGRRRGATGRWPASTAGSAPGLMPACSPRSAWSNGRKYAGRSSPTVREISEKGHVPIDSCSNLAATRRRWAATEIMNDVMIVILNTWPMCSATRDGAGAAVVASGRAQDAVAGAAEARGEQSGPRPDDGPVGGGPPAPDVNQLTRNVAAEVMKRPGASLEDLDLVELYDCSPRRAGATTRPGPRARADLELRSDLALRHDAGQRVRALSPGDPSLPLVPPTSGRFANDLRGEVGTARSRAPGRPDRCHRPGPRPAASGPGELGAQTQSTAPRQWPLRLRHHRRGYARRPASDRRRGGHRRRGPGAAWLTLVVNVGAGIRAGQRTRPWCCCRRTAVGHG